MVSYARNVAASFYGRHQETCDILAFSIAFGLTFLALGGALYLLAGALTGWRG